MVELSMVDENDGCIVGLSDGSAVGGCCIILYVSKASLVEINEAKLNKIECTHSRRFWRRIP